MNRQERIDAAHDYAEGAYYSAVTALLAGLAPTSAALLRIAVVLCGVALALNLTLIWVGLHLDRIADAIECVQP